MGDSSIVLVVEDDEESRETLRELLEWEGYGVRTATNGREALGLLDQLDSTGALPCMVLLDLFMPIMDGWMFLDQLRADGRWKNLKIVITTSAPHRAPKDIPVLGKPLDLDQVMRMVEANC